MSKEIIEQQVYEPKIEDKKPVSFIWILPLIILAILGWIAYESYMKKGTNISVIFKSAEGLWGCGLGGWWYRPWGHCVVPGSEG